MRKTTIAACDIINSAYKRHRAAGHLLLALLLLYLVAILIAGFMGLAHFLSPFGTIIIFTAVLGLRLTLPFCAMVFIGAWSAWALPWLAAAILVAPILFAIIYERGWTLRAFKAPNRVRR